jgi:hypothetical protein
VKVLIPNGYVIAQNDATTIYEGADDSAIAAWDAATEYPIGSLVRRICPPDSSTIDIPAIEYVCEARTDIGADVDPATNTLEWHRVRASAPYLAFDRYADSASVYAEDGVLEVTYSKSAAFWVILAGRFRMEIVRADGTVLWTEEITQEQHIRSTTDGWFTYFFTDFTATGAQALYRETPTDFDISLRFTSLRDGSAIFRLVIGALYFVGDTQLGAEAGILDYSVKETSDSGETYLKEGRFAKRATFSLSLNTAEFSLTHSVLSQLRAKPTVWIGDANVNALQIYGFYRDFSQLYTLHSRSECNLEIEGLV